jgi:membrane protein implicated in regulation of membrane protease activity
MKYFFWLSAALYVAVYFYAAWIYDGFSMPLAIFIFILVVGFFYWRYKRYVEVQAKQQSEPELFQHSPMQRQEMSFWRSPIPYVGILALVIIFVALGM